jgi:2-oxoglutarate ferredoxin oxidoreductase subunit alpha
VTTRRETAAGSGDRAGRAQPASTRIALVSGNELIATGAIAAGCRFFSGYPITPASEIYASLMRRLPALGGVAIGAPDEISAISYAVGASLAGVPAMTATSGPGWSLMSETVGYAVMTETPLVVVGSQRMGPATGGATQNAQGDLRMVAGAVSGGYPLPVLCPADTLDCYALTVEAFSWSERLRSPVVLLTDKETSKTVESIDIGALPAIEPLRRSLASADTEFIPYRIEETCDVPAFAPVGGDRKITVTGSAHDEAGRLRKNDPETLRQLEHLAAKIDSRAAELERVRLLTSTGSRTLIVSYGISVRCCREAREALALDGVATDLLEVLSLYPLPRLAVERAASPAERVVVVEENRSGLYATDLEPLLAGRDVQRVTSVGSMITPDAVARAVLR